MFIWDFVADTVLGQIIDWLYGQIVGFLGDFFMQMGSMGAELFEELGTVCCASFLLSGMGTLCDGNRSGSL